jgi:hypothetical protein
LLRFARKTPKNRLQGRRGRLWVPENEGEYSDQFRTNGDVHRNAYRDGSGREGDLAFCLSFPADVTAARLELARLMKGDEDTDPDSVNLLNTAYLTEAPPRQSRGAVKIPSGYYRITVRLSKTAYGKTLRTVKNLTAHIRGSLQTTLNETFGSADLKEYFTTLAAPRTYLNSQSPDTANSLQRSPGNAPD